MLQFSKEELGWILQGWIVHLQMEQDETTDLTNNQPNNQADMGTPSLITGDASSGELTGRDYHPIIG